MALKPMFTLGLKRYVEGATDPYGSPVDSWADPVDWPVYVYASGKSVAPEVDARDPSEILWTVFAPTDGLPTERDLVVLDGDEYAVDGRPMDYSHGLDRGEVGQGVVYLKRVEG